MKSERYMTRYKIIVSAQPVSGAFKIKELTISTENDAAMMKFTPEEARELLRILQYEVGERQ